MTAQTPVGAELRHTIGAKGRFVLRVPSGDVRITGTDSADAVVRERGGRDLTDRFEIGTGPNSLELVSKPRFGISISIDNHTWGRGSSSLEIEVPAGADVTVQTASGDVVTTGLVGRKEFRTASGDLSLEATAGELDLDAVSGDVRVEATGVLDFHGKTISGDLKVRAPRVTRFDLATTSGDVWLDAELNGSGPFSIKSISGDVLLVSRGSFQVEAQTITGDLDSQVAHRRESSPGRKVLSIGRAGPTLNFKSVSGDLQVVEAREMQAQEQQVRTMNDIDSIDRPGDSEPTTGSPAADPDGSARAQHADSALDVLKALERGEIDVETATARLAKIEEA
jgi:Putative adhesin